MRKKVIIVQPYVPAYRVPFFEKLQLVLAEKGVESVVAAGTPTGGQAGRGDSVQPDWLVPVQHKTLPIRSRSLDLAIWPTPWKQADAVILGLEGSSLPVYQALATARQKKMKVGLWGHVRPYVAPGNGIDLWLEKHQMYFADQIFAYTPGGKEYAIKAGVSAEKITTVMNTIDTTALSDELQRRTKKESREYASYFNVPLPRTVCYIGGLDKSKRIEFLAVALDELWEIDNRVRVLIGGDGPDKILLEPAFRRGQAIDLGYLTTHEKSAVLDISRFILMPGRIGLVAVDALVARTPIISTRWEHHAPENEYLREGISKITSSNDPVAYAQTIVRQLDNNVITNVQPSDWQYPSIHRMVDNFASGVMAMLAR